MGIKTVSLLVACFGMTICEAAIAQEAPSPDAAYEARKARMRTFGSTMRNLRSLEGEAMIDAANIYVEGFATIIDLFPQDSIVEASNALPAIWENWNGFIAIVDKANETAAGLRIAAETGDQTAFLAAAQALAPICQECHESFRAPM